jgi:hypothetical protein
MVVLVLLFNRAALRATHTPPESAPLSVSTSAPVPRTALAPVPVTPPPASAGAARHCPPLLAVLPPTLADLPARSVDSPSPYVAAWGEPPVLVRCGVSRPAGFVVGTQTIVVNGVTWYPEPHGSRTVWTAVDRPVYLEVTVPTGYASGPVADLSVPVARTLEAQPIRPGR